MGVILRMRAQTRRVGGSEKAGGRGTAELEERLRLHKDEKVLGLFSMACSATHSTSHSWKAQNVRDRSSFGAEAFALTFVFKPILC